MNNTNWGGKRAGSGRKPTGKNTVGISLTLKKEEAELLKTMAADFKMTVSDFVSNRLQLAEIIAEMNKNNGGN